MVRRLATLSKYKKVDFGLGLVGCLNGNQIWGIFICLLAWLPHPLSIVPLRPTRLRHVQLPISNLCAYVYSVFMCICVWEVCVCTVCACVCACMCVCLAHVVLRDCFLCITWQNSQLYPLKSVFMMHHQVLHLPLFIH